jgi:urocanate hydratase
MIFQSLMSSGKSRCDILSDTTQGHACLQGWVPKITQKNNTMILN